MLTPVQPKVSAPRSAATKVREGDKPVVPADVDDALAERVAAAVIAAQAGAANAEESSALQQRMQFDAVLRQRAELDRELNALRDLSMEQVKRDDELLKKWIALI